MTGPRPLHRSWGGRLLLGLVVVIAHLALLAFFLSPASRPQAASVEAPIALSLDRGAWAAAVARRPASPVPIASSAEQAPSAQPPPAPASAAPTPIPVATPDPVANDAPPAASGAAGQAPSAAVAGGDPATPGGPGGCGMVQRLTVRLQGDAGVLTALRAVPAPARSVANAIQFWDGVWASAASVGGPQVLVPIREAVVQAVQAAPQACRAELVHGPRLIVARDGAGATIVSLGSGVWAWKDLLRPEESPANAK